MNKLLEKAIAEVAALPENEQEAVAARILDEVKQRVPQKGKWAEGDCQEFRVWAGG